jgi:Protein of unknown function (DUF4013)
MLAGGSSMSTTSTPAGGNTLDFGRAFQFVPEDPDWIKKVLIGGAFSLLSLLIVGGIFVAGYFLEVIRRVARGEPRPLPDWDDLGSFFSEGLLAVGVYVAHFLALMAIPIALGCLAGLFAGGLGGLMHPRHGGDEVAAAVGMGLGLLYVFIALASLLLFLYIPSAMARLAMTHRFSAGFEFRENVAFIRRNLLNYVLALVLYMLASFVAQFAVILCCVGVFPVSFWAVCILGWALGETVRRDPLAGRGAI